MILWSMVIFAVGSFGAGAASDVPRLLVWRVIQAFGASTGLSVGIGVLADIYKLEKRGRASGIFFGVRLSDLHFLAEPSDAQGHTGYSVWHVGSSDGRRRHRPLLLVAHDAVRLGSGRYCVVPPHIVFPARDEPTWGPRGGQTHRKRREIAMGLVKPIRKHRPTSQSKRHVYCESRY